MKWKTVDSVYQYKSPFGNLRKDTCQLPDGTIIQDYHVNEYADWVNAIVVTKENDIVLVEQYRHPGNDHYIEIPAGKVEEGETYEEAIIREVREETGYGSDKSPVKLGEFMVNPATQTNKIITYLIIDASKQYEQELDETERLDVHLVHVRRLQEMIETQEITQLFTVFAYHLAKESLLVGGETR